MDVPEQFQGAHTQVIGLIHEDQMRVRFELLDHPLDQNMGWLATRQPLNDVSGMAPARDRPPNKRLQPTPYSLLSSVASASGRS